SLASPPIPIPPPPNPPLSPYTTLFRSTAGALSQSPPRRCSYERGRSYARRGGSPNPRITHPEPTPHHSGVDMYTLLNNQNSSKFDLYLPGKLVASLHYKLEKEKNEVMFIYCEAIETLEAAHHCRELMWRATENVRNRRMRIIITCPIALRVIREFESDKASASEQQSDGGTELPA